MMISFLSPGFVGAVTTLVLLGQAIVAFDQYPLLGVCVKQQQDQSTTEEDERCAVHPSHCEPSHIDGTWNVQGERWYDGYRQNQRIASQEGSKTCRCDSSTPLGACLVQDGSGNVSYRCAAHELLCNANEVFVESATDVSSVTSCDCVTTLYGACRDPISDEHFCAYKPSDCTDTESSHQWVAPDKVEEELGFVCNCQNVRLGGCVGGFQGFGCALTADDCSWSPYYPPLELQRKFGYSCRLCKPSDGNPLNPSVVRDEIVNLSAQEKKSGLSAGIWSAIVAAIILVLVAMLAFRHFRLKRHKAESTASTGAKEVEIKETIHDSETVHPDRPLS